MQRWEMKASQRRKYAIRIQESSFSPIGFPHLPFVNPGKEEEKQHFYDIFSKQFLSYIYT